MKFRLNIALAKSSTTLYHGDDFGTKALTIERMIAEESGNLEGIGVYFSDNRVTAEHYGKHIVSAEIDKKDYIRSRELVRKLGTSNVLKFFNFIYDTGKYNEELFFWLTDYGLELSEVEDVRKSHFREALTYLVKEEIRNFQIDICQRFDIHIFLEAWNHSFKYKGTYNVLDEGRETWYAILDTSLKVKPV